MSKLSSEAGAGAVNLPVEAAIEALNEGAFDVHLRTDQGVLLHCGRALLPADARVGERVVVETAVYMAPLKKWRVARARSLRAPLVSPTDAAEAFWAGALGALDTPAALLDALAGGTRALAALVAYGMAGGRTLLPEEKQAHREVGVARLGDLVRRAGQVAPTLARRRLADSAAEGWAEQLSERALTVAPDIEGAAPELVRALTQLRERVALGACGQASVAAPAAPYERALHHARVKPPGPIRELLGLANGFVLHGGVARMFGIFDGGMDQLGSDAGEHAGVIHFNFPGQGGALSQFCVTCSDAGQPVAHRLTEAPSGSSEWREVAAADAALADHAALLTALATRSPTALRRLFTADAPPWRLPPEPADLAAIQDPEHQEAALRALGAARAAAGDPFGAWVLAQLAGKVAPDEAELSALAGALAPAFRRGLDDAPGLVVEFRRGFASRVQLRSTFDYHARHLLRELSARPFGRRYQHLTVALLNVSHPHRMGDLWELLDEVGLPPGFRALCAGNTVAEHHLPARLPPMEELTLIGYRMELPQETHLDPLKRLTLDGAARFGDLRGLRWPAPELLTLRAPRSRDAEDAEQAVASPKGLAHASFIPALPRLRLEGWGAAGARPLADALARSKLRRIELSCCDAALVTALRSRLGARLEITTDP